MRNKKGFTLIEVLGVVVIISLVIGMIGSILFFGVDVYKLTSTDFQIQSDVRLAMERTNTMVRYSKALFAVPDTSYLDAEWSYIGLSADETRIINYRWDSASSSHVQETLVGPYEGITFKIGFTKADTLSKDKSLQMYFESYSQDGTVKRYDIQTGYEALNALQVVDYGTALVPATALAYRGEQDYVYENNKIIVNIAMVLDTSGSMEWGLNDPDGRITSSNPSRISVLRTQAEMIVEQFASNGNSDVSIYISLVPFASLAPTPSTFYNVKNAAQREDLIDAIGDLSANGSTNTGDGLRRGYHQLNTKSTNDLQTIGADTIVKNYTLSLVDGESNTASMYNTSSSSTTWGCTWWLFGRCLREGNVTTTTWQQYYYADSGTIRNCSFTSTSTSCTPGYVSGTAAANEYVDLMGEFISDADRFTNYVVSFATDVSVSEIVFIADATNTPDEHVFYATNADQLGLSFTEIQLSITNSLWQFLGPKLAPELGGS